MKKEKTLMITQKHSYIFSVKNKGVYLLKPQHTIIRYLTFPKMKKREIEEALITEYSSYAAIFGGTPYINWKVVEEKEDKISVLSIGVKKELLDEIYQEIFQKQRIQVFSAVAVVGVIGELVRDIEDIKDFGVILIGEKQSDFLLYKNGSPVYGRNINIGVNDIFRDVGVSERDIMDMLSYIDEAIIRNFSSPVKIYVASIVTNDRDLVLEISRLSSYSIIPLTNILEIDNYNEAHEIILKAAWNLGVNGHDLFTFVPPAYKEWQKLIRKSFYLFVLLITIILMGIGSINLTYTKLNALKYDLSVKTKQLNFIQSQIEALRPYEEKYNTLINKREMLGRLAFIENQPHKYYPYYQEIFYILRSTHGSVTDISPEGNFLTLSINFSSEEDMISAISLFKASNKFGRVVIYSTTKTQIDNTVNFVLNIGVMIK